MNRNNGLYFIVGVLVVVVVGFGIYTYQQETKPKGVELNIGETGITIQKN
ncbi:MAG: hypothetical protein ACOH2J_19045 [Allorhizobium sp.]